MKVVWSAKNWSKRFASAPADQRNGGERAWHLIATLALDPYFLVKEVYSGAKLYHNCVGGSINGIIVNATISATVTQKIDA